MNNNLTTGWGAQWNPTKCTVLSGSGDPKEQGGSSLTGRRLTPSQQVLESPSPLWLSTKDCKTVAIFGDVFGRKQRWEDTEE